MTTPINTYGWLAIVALLGIIFAPSVILIISSNSNRDWSSDPRCTDTAPYRDSSVPVEDRITDLMRRMTVAEKIGQLTLIEHQSLRKLTDIRDFHIGALLSGGGGGPSENTPAGWRAMIDQYQAVARETCLRIPLLYGVDATHGHGNIPAATMFPQAIGLAAANDATLVRRIAEATRAELVATNIQWQFGPNLDVAQDMRWGRVYETYGSRTEVATRLGQAYLLGLQDTASTTAPVVLGTVKHYLGAGNMVWGTSVNADYRIDQGDVRISESELRRRHLPPFQAAVEAGALSVMVGLNSWQGTSMVHQRYWLTDVLKDELKFQGFVVSDWYGVYEASPNAYQATIEAINAGVDMVMLPFDYEVFAWHMMQAVSRGDISESRLDDAVRRILRAKFAIGLFDDPGTPPDLDVIGSAAHRELAREAVRSSLVLLKNNRQTLPLRADVGSVMVGGSAADNLGQQMGGWTVEWQGVDGNWLPGTTLLAAIRQAVSSSTTITTYNPGDDPATTTRSAVGIAIVGEKPYAEGQGDDEHPQLSPEDQAVIAGLRARSDRLVVIIISGRPLDIYTQSQQWDAIVAAWLPGSEGEGVTDVLFGQYPFVGRLPVTWAVR